jgi:hypothetical protein
MQQAADRLGTQLTDAKTVVLEIAAWSRLRDLAQTLKSDLSSAGPSENQESSDSGPPSEGEAISFVAQLKLLKTLEQDILRRTGELDRQRREKADSSRGAADVELDRLAAEQGELATLIRQLASQGGGRSEQGKATRPSKDR